MTKPLAFIVEDDPGLGEVFSLSLKDKFDTEISSNGNTALARLRQIIPAIIVLDLHLPGISGTELLRQIQSDERLVSTRVILCTADAHEANTLREDVDLVLLKPVSPAQLRELASRLYSVH